MSDRSVISGKITFWIREIQVSLICLDSEKDGKLLVTGVIGNSRVSKELPRREMGRFYVNGDYHYQGPLLVVHCLCIAACLLV